jgi:hypothetical protein
MFETLYLSMDANFKLKQKDRGFSDPPLANGLAYMVSNGKLLTHLAKCKGEKVLEDEVSISCNLIHNPLIQRSGGHVRFKFSCDQ